VDFGRWWPPAAAALALSELFTLLLVVIGGVGPPPTALEVLEVGATLFADELSGGGGPRPGTL